MEEFFKEWLQWSLIVLGVIVALFIIVLIGNWFVEWEIILPKLDNGNITWRGLRIAFIIWLSSTFLLALFFHSME